MTTPATTYKLGDLHKKAGPILRSVAAGEGEAIITDSGTPLGVFISMADYQRLHELADLYDALRAKAIQKTPYSPVSLAEILDELEIDPTDLLAS